jgi:hypothetical protein
MTKVRTAATAVPPLDDLDLHEVEAGEIHDVPLVPKPPLGRNRFPRWAFEGEAKSVQKNERRLEFANSLVTPNPAYERALKIIHADDHSWPESLDHRCTVAWNFLDCLKGWISKRMAQDYMRISLCDHAACSWTWPMTSWLPPGAQTLNLFHELAVRDWEFDVFTIVWLPTWPMLKLTNSSRFHAREPKGSNQTLSIKWLWLLRYPSWTVQARHVYVSALFW